MKYGKRKNRPLKLHVRLLEAERLRWKRAAVLSGKTLSAWIREMLNELSGYTEAQ